MAGVKDLYSQFKDITVTLDATDSTTLATNEISTGLSIRGDLVWLIHKIEVYFSEDSTAASTSQYLVLSTRKGETTLPGLGTAGVICKCKYVFEVVTAVSTYVEPYQPFQMSYLPPIPIAKPTIHAYANTSVDSATLRGDDIEARILFTTEKLDEAMYQEVAEVWGW